MPDPGPEPAVSSPERFDTTRWSVVLAARDGSSPGAREALEALCSAYWYPLYAFIRRRGYDGHAAQDLIQEFFARVLEKNTFGSADPSRGRFRSFLLASCSHFLANRRDHDRARKRGGDRIHVPLDPSDAEGRYCLEPAHGLTAERLFHRRWALTLLQQVVERLEAEAASAGKGPLFNRLKSCLTGERGSAHYAAVARDLGTSEAAIKMAAHRLRRRYQDVLREEIARTVDDPAEVDDEIRDLFAALSH